MKAILPYFLLIVGLTFAVFGIKFLTGMISFRKNAIKTTGTVIEVNTARKLQEMTYSPVISFTTATGKEIVYDANRFRYQKYNLGDKIAVYYNEKNPWQANLDSNTETYKGPFLVLLIAVVLVFIGLYMLFRR